MKSKIKKIDPQRLETSAAILKSIAHPLRLGIADVLRHTDELSVNQICELLGSEQSLTSHHLTSLKLKGLIGCRRDGKQMFYHLEMKEITSIFDCLEKCECVI